MTNLEVYELNGGCGAKDIKDGNYGKWCVESRFNIEFGKGFYISCAIRDSCKKCWLSPYVGGKDDLWKKACGYMSHRTLSCKSLI